uniref:Laminin, gamma 2 n=1 Tax=Neogobius melanostomus TaxID=47308 RepID=A0A8C6UXE1_9GOBI
MRHSVPCGQKQFYTLRLEESQWSPQLSSFTFQKLLHNLTAIKIRATFGHSGRGYLDNVSLVSARPDVGTVPAGWVRSCRCPAGLEGAQCERCVQGYRRSESGLGAFSDCEPCQCPQGSCDALTGECLSSDDSQGCKHGYTGPNCADCSEGFYREMVRGDGFPAPCEPCACDKHGSVSAQCDSSGTCRCKTGFDGQKCERSKCPSCFSPVTAKLGLFSVRLLELEQQFSRPVDTGDMEAALKAAQRELDDLQEQHQDAKDVERRLQRRVSPLGPELLTLGQEVTDVAQACSKVHSSKEKYTEQVDATEDLIQDMRSLLKQAQRSLQSAELPQADSPADAPTDTNPFSPLLQKALDLLQKHQTDAASIDAQAGEALKDSERSATLAQPIVEREKQVHKITDDLGDMLERISTEVKDMEIKAPQVTSAAKDQSKMAASLLQDILKAEKDLPTPLKAEAEGMLSSLDGLKAVADGNLKELDKLKAAVEPEQTSAMGLLAKGKTAQEAFDKLVGRVDQAKSDTEDALRRIGSNTDDLEGALSTLKGFDDQMAQARALSDAAIGRLPAINATIQSANGDNTVARGLVAGISEQLRQAGETSDKLQDAVDDLQGLWRTVPNADGLLDRATLLRSQAEKLRDGSSSTAAEVKNELGQAKDLKQQATQGAEDAQAALDNTQRTRDAVRRTLRDVNNMINGLNGSEPVDMSRLEELEKSLGAAQKEVLLGLEPRLKQLLEKEQAHIHYLNRLDQDLSTIQGDIQNIKNILKSVPTGCYNNAPLEEA